MTWSSIPLGEIGTWYGGGTPSKARSDYWTNGSIPWLSPKDMGPEVLSGTRDKITPSALSGSATRLVPAQSVAVVMRSGILERTLPVALVPFEATLNQDMKAVVPHSEVDPRWIAWGLRAFEQELLSTTRKAGTTVASIEFPRFREFELPVPDLSEQHRIVEILEDHLSRLDAGDDYVSVSERRLRTLENAIVESVFHATSGSYVPLGHMVAKIEAGKSLGSTAGPAGDGEWGIIKVSAMTWGEFRATENKAIPSDRALPKFEIHPGDLLVSRANTSDYVGASVLVPDGVRSHLLLSDKSLRLIPTRDVDPGWLWRVLQSPGVRSQISRLATGTKDSMRNISQKSLLQVQVPHMSFQDQLEAVQQYAVVESQLSNLRRALGQAHARSQSLRRAVLEAAFVGQLTGRRADYEVIEERAHAG